MSIHTSLGHNDYLHLFKLYLLNLPLRLRTLNKTKNTPKQSTKKAYKGIISQCEELQLSNNLINFALYLLYLQQNT